MKPPVSDPCGILKLLKKTALSLPACRLPTARSRSVAPEEEQPHCAIASAEGSSVRSTPCTQSIRVALLMSEDRRMFIRPNPDDLASDEAIEAFAQQIWQAFTTKENHDDESTD